jgi:hypothetical protein
MTTSKGGVRIAGSKAKGGRKLSKWNKVLGDALKARYENISKSAQQSKGTRERVFKNAVEATKKWYKSKK